MFELQVFNHGLLAYSRIVDIDTLCENDTEDAIDLVAMTYDLHEHGHYDFTMCGLQARILDCPHSNPIYN